MNERIKNLSKKAWLLTHEANDQAEEDEGEELTETEFGNVFQQKFAELIVKECISINRQRMFSDYEGDSHRVAHNNALWCATSDMFKHFGVGE